MCAPAKRIDSPHLKYPYGLRSFEVRVHLEILLEHHNGITRVHRRLQYHLPLHGWERLLCLECGEILIGSA